MSGNPAQGQPPKSLQGGPQAVPQVSEYGSHINEKGDTDWRDNCRIDM